MSVRVALIGIGHIGGSLALALRAAGKAQHVTGYDKNSAHATLGLRLGIVDAVAADVRAAVAIADLVILATPVRGIQEILGEIAPAIRSDALVIDVGSTKHRIVTFAYSNLTPRLRFVGCHPLAGTENSGPCAAEATLFRGKKVILTPHADTEGAALEAARALWESVGADVRQMSSSDHDRLLASVSHLPHVIAFALAQATGRVLHDFDGQADGLFGTSLRDMTRVAKSHPVTWRDIFLENRENLLHAIDDFADRLKKLRDGIACQDEQELETLIAKARQERMIFLSEDR